MQFSVIKLSLKWQLNVDQAEVGSGTRNREIYFILSRGDFLLMDNYTLAVLRSQGGERERGLL